uniref:Golgi associated RAB2 interactor protein-like Rab2B-binding domain-containing protein n=1 Tax=Erpetoichthys calabaricus TaxID=27687 RepID=A0A8C4TEN3_ERPCA
PLENENYIFFCAVWLASFNLTCQGKLWHIIKKENILPFCDSFIFESDFVEVTETGQVSSLSGGFQSITVGVTSSDPKLSGPDTLLLAKAVNRYKRAASEGQGGQRHTNKIKVTQLELKRAFILIGEAGISVHNLERRELKVKLDTGQIFYLQLCVPVELEKVVFDQWIVLVNKLTSSKFPKETKQPQAPDEQNGDRSASAATVGIAYEDKTEKNNRERKR